MQLLPHNYAGSYTNLAGHIGNPHNFTKTTTKNLSNSNSWEEVGDQITRQPIPLAVYPFQIRWDLINRSVGSFPSSSRILPNLTTAIPHESFQEKHIQWSFTSTTYSLSTNSCITLESRFQNRSGYSPLSLLSPPKRIASSNPLKATCTTTRNSRLGTYSKNSGWCFTSSKKKTKEKTWENWKFLPLLTTC